jgi:hypothetical protein
MPGDNSSAVASGADVQFPQDGPAQGSSISRVSGSTINLAAIGYYEVTFVVPVTEPGQLVLTVDTGAGPVPLAYTVVGRSTGATEIVGHSLVQTTVINELLAVENPAGESNALTITPTSGGLDPASASLIIQQVG